MRAAMMVGSPVRFAMLRRAAYIAGFLAAIGFAVISVTGCGGGSAAADGPTLDEVLTQVEGLSGAARTKKLVELAEAEGGELSLYTTSSLDVSAAMAEGFEDAYDLDVSVFKSGDTLPQRMIEEKKAGFHGADVVETNAINLSALSDEDVLAPYRGPSVSGLVEGSLHKDWIADRLNVFAVAWNTKLVPKGEEPRSWEDLADPRWKGKLLLQVDDYEWFKTLWEYWVDSGKTPAEADRLAEAVARNAIFIDSRSLGRELLAAGEFDIALNLRHAVQNDADEGAPLAWEPAVEPMFWRPDGVAAVNGSPNPAAAVLFMDWVLADGQKVFEELKADPLRKDLLVAPTVKQIPVDVEDFLAEEAEWEQKYDAIVSLGAKGPEGS
jgi:iron(III) transport system substrate-binding protein